MEPSIKAKITLDTSELNKIGGASGSNSVGTNISNRDKKDSKNLEKMTDVISGPLQTSALLNIKNLAGAVGGGATGVIGGILAALGIKEGVSSLTNMTDELAFNLDQKGVDEGIERYIEQLEAQAKQLEENGDFEGALKIRDEISDYKKILENIRDKSLRFQENIEDAETESIGMGGVFKKLKDGADTIADNLLGLNSEITVARNYFSFVDSPMRKEGTGLGPGVDFVQSQSGRTPTGNIQADLGLGPLMFGIPDETTKATKENVDNTKNNTKNISDETSSIKKFFIQIGKNTVDVATFMSFINGYVGSDPDSIESNTKEVKTGTSSMRSHINSINSYLSRIREYWRQQAENLGESGGLDESGANSGLEGG